MKVLVTGGAGYIGSHAVQKLREAGHETVVYDNLSNGFESSVPDGELIVADLNDETALAAAFNGVDAVMHFAASIFSDESVAEPLKYYDNNVAGLLCLLRQCRRARVRYFVFSSSAAVYAPSGAPTSEDSPLGPSNSYGWSKMMGERILLDEQHAGNQSDGLRCAILRYYNAAGADPEGRIGPLGTARHLLRVAVRAAVGATDGVTIYGTDYDTSDGTCVRDYIHVEDLARIHVDALKHLVEGRGGSEGGSLLLNCGYGRGHSVREVIAAVKRVTGENFPVREGERRAGDVALLGAGNRRLRSTLGWTPTYDDLGTIVRHAWEWEKQMQTASSRRSRAGGKPA